MHTAKSLKAKKLILYFHTTKKNFKKKLFQLAFLVLITSLLKLRELGQHFKNSKKIILFSFNIRDYKFIRKTYS